MELASITSRHKYPSGFPMIGFALSANSSRIRNIVADYGSNMLQLMLTGSLNGGVR